jgi:hypothetical protein
MEVITELSVLIAGTARLLKRKKYRPATLESYHLTWRRIKEYMAAEHIPEFTKEVGDAFIKARLVIDPVRMLRCTKTTASITRWCYGIISQTIVCHQTCVRNQISCSPVSLALYSRTLSTSNQQPVNRRQYVYTSSGCTSFIITCNGQNKL